MAQAPLPHRLRGLATVALAVAFMARLVIPLAVLFAPSACRDEDPHVAPPGSPADARTDDAAGASPADALPAEVDADEAARLRALGYVEVGQPLPADARVGVVLWDRERAAPGLTLITHSHFCRTEILDLSGQVLHAWQTEPCERWGNSVITPEGDLLVVGRVPHEQTPEAASRARYLARLAWDGSERWRRTMPAHHDVELTPEGRVSTLTYALRDLPEVHAELPTRDHALVVLDASGELLEEAWFSGLLRSAPDVFLPDPVKPRRFNDAMEVDLIHGNSLEWLRKTGSADALLAPGRVLVCFRNQDAVAIFDWARRRLVWAWGKGELSGPHDATLLDDGHILVFDNGLGRNWSRVVEVDPRSGEIVWEYRAPEPRDFYTTMRGAAQRLTNGNTLITESDDGRAFEVTREGEIVWEYRNPNLTELREPSVLVRARRIEGVDFAELEALVQAGELPFVD